MADIGTFKNSKFLTQFDCDPPLVVTIASVSREMVGQGENAEEKPIVRFREDVKAWVAGIQSLEIIAAWCGRDTDGWVGKQIELYRDPNIAFGGQIKGGIRPRKPASATAPASSLMTLAQARAACAEIGADEKDMFAFLRSNGKDKYDQASCTHIVREFLAQVQAAPADMPSDDAPHGEDSIPFSHAR